MDCRESQEEELEVLASIYDGDANFKQISQTCFQYKIGNDDDPRSFLLEISWGEQYPNLLPTISLDAFFNKKLMPEVKSAIINMILKEAEMQIGTPMTYTLFEWAKYNADTLTELQPDHPVSVDSASPSEEKVAQEDMVSTKKEKKPQLSKHQKKKLAEKLDSKGEHVRGWDWVDVVKHLSQIGSKQPTDAS